MDIVGPLPRSRSGNRYMLVMCDYATRYPEAIPLKSIDAEHIVLKLLTGFKPYLVQRFNCAMKSASKYILPP